MSKNMVQQGICVLGSTGSIGENTLNVISQHPHQFKVVALSAKQSYKKLFQQCLQFQPQYAVLIDEQAASELVDRLRKAGLSTEVLVGASALNDIVALAEVQKVMNAIVGAKGLLPTMAAIQAAKTVLIANKEPLVMAGHLMMAEAKRYGATIIPVDSEHNGVYQCLPDTYEIGKPLCETVSHITLTASGGPFRTVPKEQFVSVTPEMACQHPNWDMGPKITIDCATLMNKGLEVIEAVRLFGLKKSQISVVIHPQSVVHALVRYEDGSILAHLGSHDMRIAIAYSLAWPERCQSGAEVLDLTKLGTLEFSEPDLDKFPCLRLAYEALSLGEGAPNVLNACNETVVQAFLNQRVRFSAIPVIIESILSKFNDLPSASLEEVLDSDERIRHATEALLAKI